tara:strand:+ start:3886 stop:5073 length:1188 start_codon:yes stop_codon:yes gene_type:complete
MRDISEIIQFENENSYIDFKANQYHKTQNAELLKDILAFANSSSPGDKYIIIGVKVHPDGQRDFIGIKEDQILDSSSYEQLVRANIEPDLNIEFFIHRFQNQKYGVFRIVEPKDKPYLIKKDYSKLKKGESLIRKGTFKMPLNRSDLDEMYLVKGNNSLFNGAIDIRFSGLDYDQTLNATRIKELNLKSERIKEKLISIIKKKEEELEASKLGVEILGFNAYSPFYPTPFENRSLDTLRKNLENVRETYADHDNYEAFELHSEKINIEFLNKGKSYLEDCTIEIIIPSTDGMFLFDEFHSKPKRTITPLHPSYPITQTQSWESMNYPKFKKIDSNYWIEIDMGNLKHNLITQAFQTPLRIMFLPLIEVKKIPIKIKIHAKNLTTPINKELIINID